MHFLLCFYTSQGHANWLAKLADLHCPAGFRHRMQWIINMWCVCTFSYASSAAGVDSTRERCHQENLWMCHCMVEADQNNVFQLSCTTPPFLGVTHFESFPSHQFNQIKKPVSQVKKEKYFKKSLKSAWCVVLLFCLWGSIHKRLHGGLGCTLCSNYQT